jgi:hypothetical protein
MMLPTLGPMELQDLKRDVRRPGETLQKVKSDAGQIVDQAITASGMSRDTAAREMGISPSLLTRQIQNTDNQHISFQRLWLMPDRFKRELIETMAADIEGVSVRTLVVVERRTA